MQPTALNNNGDAIPAAVVGQEGCPTEPRHRMPALT
jgi:hypothetical protein